MESLGAPVRRPWSRWRLATFSVLAWGLIAVGWWRVAARGRFVAAGWLFALPIFAALLVMITLGWVRHNRGIYLRKGPRTAVPVGIHDYSRDRLGRPIDADFSRLQGAREIVVSIDGPVKSYR